MKRLKFLTVALAALAMVSCSKDNNNDVVDSASKTLRVKIGGKATKADTPSVGEESNITSFAVFAVVEGGKYKCQVATGTPLTAEITDVKSNTDVYVIANYDATNAAIVDAAQFTETELKALQETILKADIEAFNVAIRQNPTAPIFNGKAMLMTGHAATIGNNAAADGTILLTVDVEREFSKIDVGTPVVKPDHAFNEELTNKNVTVNGIQGHSIRRIAPISNYFGLLSLPTVGVADVYPTDNGYRITGTATDKLYYVTRNDATSKTQSTAVVYEVQYTSTQGLTIGGVAYPANTAFSRFYKAYVTNNAQDVTATAKNTFFSFDNKITGWGADSEDNALVEEVDMDVVLTAKNWTVAAIAVDMD